MLGFHDTGKLMKLMTGGEGKIIIEVLSDFDSIFSLNVKSYAIGVLDLMLSMKEPKLFPPAQRMIAFAILHRANGYENASSNPLTSILVDAACDEKAEKYERAFVLGLLGIPIPPVNCTELLKQSANDYVRIMEEKFKRVPPQFPPREVLLEKYVSKTSKPFNSVFRRGSVIVIPDPDVPKGCNSSSTEFDNSMKLRSGDRAKAARGVRSNLSMEGLSPQWIRPFPPRLPVMENELRWLNPDMDHELVWDYGMCSDAKALKGSVVHEKQEQVMVDLADDPKLVEGFGKSEQEEFEDLFTENPNSSTTENHETQVAGLGLVAESLEKTEFHDLPSESDNECEDQNGVVSTETSGLCNESSHVVVNANGSKSQEEMTDAQEEAPPATSTDSDLELHSTNNMEILGGRGELNNLSSDKNADDATDVYESQISPNETCSENLGSSDVSVDAVEFALEGQNEANLEKEMIERVELEVPVTISVDSGLQASSANDPKAQTIENKASLEPADSDLQASVLDTVVCSEKESRFQNGDLQVETEVSSCKGKTVHVPSATVNTKLDHAKAQASFSVTFKKDLLESVNIYREAASNITWGSTNIKFGTADIVDKSYGNSVISDGNLTLNENKHTEICKNGSILVASSGTDEVCGEKLSIKPATNPFHYLVRVPKFDDESLKERVKLQEIQVRDCTQQRDAIQLLIRDTRKGNNQSHVSSAWKLVRSKRAEMDSLRFMINKVKTAVSIQDIDQWICSMEFKIQHESMPLKEEKQLIHEIKQQKQLHKQLLSNIGSHDEIKECLDQLETLEERMKILKKEHGILKENAEKAEAAVVEAKKKFDDECKELQARYRVSNNSRQEAYNQLKSLRKELKEKNKHFYKYKDDATAANNYACSKDRDGLKSHCKNQVEKFMELWNNNDKFRKEYVTINARRTVQKFGTLDGRALGPNEERPIIPSYVDRKVNKMISTPAKIDSVSKTLVLEQKQEMKLDNGISEEKTKGISEGKTNKKLTKPKGLVSSNDKEAAEPVSTTVSSKIVSEEVQVEVEPTKSEEEIELERKAEEMMRRENEAKLKEQLRLEEIAKAQEARERKKLKEEKEKRRAELRAQKEAEQKEKKREKRLRQKEKKNASTALTAESSNSVGTAPMPENIIETAQEIEQPKKASTTSKKPQRRVFTKRNQPRVTQPPIQIRRKRSRLQNPCVIIAAIIAAIGMIFLYITYLK